MERTEITMFCSRIWKVGYWVYLVVDGRDLAEYGIEFLRTQIQGTLEMSPSYTKLRSV